MVRTITINGQSPKWTSWTIVPTFTVSRLPSKNIVLTIPDNRKYRKLIVQPMPIGRQSPKSIVRCKVTGRKHRVSPCRSAYFASPWWLLTLDLRRRSRETALLFPESWWHLMMRGSRPSLFMIIPNTKRHLNNTKTDQLVITYFWGNYRPSKAVP